MISVCVHNRGGVLDNVLLEIPAFNASKADPTRCGLLRKQFMSAMRVRFQSLYNDIHQWLVVEDELALNAKKFQFQNDPNKLAEFNKWLEQRINQRLLQAYESNEPWIMDYVAEAYDKGYARAYDQINAYGLVKKSPNVASDKQAFVARSLGSPVRAEKLQILGTRTFESLKGTAQSVKSGLTRILTDGMANGLGPKQIAKQIKEELNMDLAKANRIARTEITHAHAEAQLESFEALNVDEVSVEAEWLTAEGACQACEDMAREGPYPVSEAHGLIPYHPNCRCAWIPSIVTTNARLTKTGKMDGRAGRDADGDGIRDEKYQKKGSLLSRVKKAFIAKASHRAVTRAVWDMAEAWEKESSGIWGLSPIPKDNGKFRAFDIVGIDRKGVRHGFEVKIIQKGKTVDRPEVKQSSILNKNRDARKYKLKVHMIVKHYGHNPPKFFYDDKVTRNKIITRREVTKKELFKMFGPMKNYEPYFK